MASGVLVIGAGVAGLAAVKACKEEGLAVTCYEREAEFGGLWRYRGGEVGRRGGSVMRSTVSNTSKEMSSFSDFPAPADFPTFMPHALVLRYLHMYADKFDLLSHVTYHQEVVSLAPAEDYETTGAWAVTVRDLRTGAERRERFEGVAACSGHHAAPHTPTYRGVEAFGGRMLHSREYRTPSGLEGKEVLVIGLGNSGGDLAVEIAGVANNVYLSTRKGSWIFPRTFEKGKPLDVCLSRRCSTLLPGSWATSRLQKRLTDRMDHDRFGVRPPHPPTSQHPTVNDELQAKLLNGSVKLRRDIKEFVADGVIFQGDTEVTSVEVVISATGYRIGLPFLSEEVLKVGPHNEVLLYKKVFPPQLKHHTLAVIGLVQPNGSLFPVAEMQARWFAALMAGRCRLPGAGPMAARARRDEAWRRRCFVASDRHFIEDGWISHLDAVASEFGARPRLRALLVRDPRLFRACVFGPCLPYQYRLFGPHRWEGARDALLGYKDRLYRHMGV